MLTQDIFNLPGKHLVPPHDEHILGAVSDEDISVLIHSDHIAGIEPRFLLILPQGVCRFFGLVVIPLHHLRTVNDQFSDFTHRHLYRSCFNINHFNPCTLQGQSDRTELLFPFAGIHCDDGARFGHAEDFHHFPFTHDRFQGRDGLFRKRRCTGNTNLTRREINFRKGRIIHQHLIEGRDMQHDAGTVFGNFLADMAGVSGIGNQALGVRHRHCYQPQIETRLMKKWKSRTGNPSTHLKVEPLCCLSDIGNKIAVGQDRPLGQARRTPCILDKTGVPGIDTHLRP